MPADPIAAEVFRHLFASVAEEMGVTLERTAYSPNIKERRDHSCALFDRQGRLVAQAAHIPVHLGAFPLLMERLVPAFQWRPGDVVICNDPYVGGTHLPDISLVTPVFTSGRRLAGFVANRAHHADVGGAFPGSMGVATELYQEGVIIPPVKLSDRGRLNDAVLELLCRNVRTPEERKGDLAAQLAANATGVRRLREIVDRYGLRSVLAQIDVARERTAAAARLLFSSLPAGRFRATDYLDDGGSGGPLLPITVELWVEDGTLVVDFAGTAPQQPGPINATAAVTRSAVYYVVCCLLPIGASLNHGAFETIEVRAPAGTLVNALPPAAVAGGNVETSQRIVDALLRALAEALPQQVPAASQGTMNNLTIGGIHPETGRPWAYYETIGGGAGAGPQGEGTAGIHCHMSNTRNTPAEAVEYHYPLRVARYALRDGSGGSGRHAGGDGIVRELELLADATVTLIADRRRLGPYGIEGGGDGAPGEDQWTDPQGRVQPLPAKGSRTFPAGTRVRISTPGGGGWGL